MQDIRICLHDELSILFDHTTVPYHWLRPMSKPLASVNNGFCLVDTFVKMVYGKAPSDVELRVLLGQLYADFLRSCCATTSTSNLRVAVDSLTTFFVDALCGIQKVADDAAANAASVVAVAATKNRRQTRRRDKEASPPRSASESALKKALGPDFLWLQTRVRQYLEALSCVFPPGDGPDTLEAYSNLRHFVDNDLTPDLEQLVKVLTLPKPGHRTGLRIWLGCSMETLLTAHFRVVARFCACRLACTHFILTFLFCCLTCLSSTIVFLCGVSREQSTRLRNA